jgi:branched-chain amino acid aminotransferase
MWLDGDLVGSGEATMPIMAQAAQRGSLVFDVGSFHTLERGALALFRAHEHVRRFLQSAHMVGLAITHDEEALVRAAADVVASAGAREGLVRWSAFFAAGEPDLLPRDPRARVAVAAQLLEDPARTAPMRVAVFDDARKAPPEVLSPRVKAAAAYLGPSLAKRRAIAEGAEEVVLLDRDGNVAEAPTANVFAVMDGALVTPPLAYVLAGITRDAVIALARRDGIAVREEPIGPEAFASADEAFLTATSFPIAPIGWVNGRALRRPSAEVTRHLTAALARAIHGEDDSDTAAAWLTRVS